MVRVIELLIRLHFKIAEACLHLAIAIVNGIVAVVKRPRTPGPQEPAPIAAITAQPVTPAAGPAPPIHVHVTLAAPPEAQPSRPERAASSAPSDAGMAGILRRADRQIYFAIGTNLVQLHPRSKDLDDQVTRMAFAAMHREGEPFMVPPSLDSSGPGVSSVTLTPPEEDFAPGAPLLLPEPDNQLYWLRGGTLSPAPAMPTRFPKPAPPEDVLLPLPFLVLPPADGRLWQIRAGTLSPLV